MTETNQGQFKILYELKIENAAMVGG